MAGIRLLTATAFIVLAAAQTPETTEDSQKRKGVRPPKRCLFKNWANLVNFEIEVENVAPEGGVCQSPVWMGIHKGDFDVFSQGEVSDDLQATTRSGGTDFTGIEGRFKQEPSAVGETIVGDAPICPGDVAKTSVVVNMPKGETSYLSFLSTVLPCSGAFVANEASVAEILYNKQGGFSFRPFVVPGSDVFRIGGSGPALPDSEGGGRRTQEQSAGRATGGCEVSEELIPDGRSSGSFNEINFNVPDYDMLKVSITRRTPVCPKAVASIKPKRVVPKIRKTESKAGGQINMRFFEDGGLFFAIQVGQLRAYRACTLNLGEAGRNGEVLVELVNSELKGSLSGAFRGFIQDDDIQNDFSKEDLWQAIGDKMVYVVCTTDKFPQGEVRGDLRFA